MANLKGFATIAPAPVQPDADLPLPGIPTFSPLQQTVIELGQHDGADTLDPRDGITALFRRTIGARSQPALANACLEALRRLVVRLRTVGVAGAAPEIAIALRSGLTPAQVAQLEERFKREAAVREL